MQNEISRSRNMMHYWMLQETARPRMIINFITGLFLLYTIFISPFRHIDKTLELILRVVVLLAVILIGRLLCTTRFFIRHSNIGKQIMRFGDFNSVYPKICAAAQTPLYTNGTEVISKDFIFLMPEPDNAPQPNPFSKSPKLTILSVKELTRVSIKPNAPFPEEMNTLIFRTLSPSRVENEKFRTVNLSGAENEYFFMMTVHLHTEAAQELTQAITKEMQENIPHANPKNHTAPLPKPRRTLAERSHARFCSDPLRELRAGKMRVFRLIVLLILLVNVGAMLFLYFMTGDRTLSRLPHDFVMFARNELLGKPDQLFFLLILLAIYLVPMLLIYMRIRCWYQHFLNEYEKLPHKEQTELLAKLCENFKTGQPVVIYTEHCFCFRNLRSLSFQTLLPYSCVLWIYRTHSAFTVPTRTPGMEQQVDFYHLIIRTANRRKYRIASGSEPKLTQHAPKAIVGYGAIQREAYLELVRENKGQ